MNRKFKSWNLKYFVTLLTSILSLLMNLLHICRTKVLISFLHIPCSASCSWPSDRFYSSCHTRGELSVHAWLQLRTMRQKTHSLFTYPTIRFASLSWACLSGEAGVSLQLLFSMCYSAAGKCIAQAAASWCHNVGLCSKSADSAFKRSGWDFPSHQFAQLPLQTVVKQEWVCIWEWGCFFHFP